MKRKYLFLLIAIVIATTYCIGFTSLGLNRVPWAAAQALRKADELTLYSIEPSPFSDAPETAERLYHYPALGSVAITSTETRKQIIDAIEKGVRHWKGDHYLCFDPRHVVRARRGSTTYDFLICYACDRIVIFRNDMRLASIGLTDSPATLNGVLSAANVPLAEIPKPADPPPLELLRPNASQPHRP